MTTLTPDTLQRGRVAAAPSRLKRRRVYSRKQRWIIGAINLSVFLLLWQAAATFTDVPRLFLPSVAEVWGELVELHTEGELWGNLWISARIFVIGMVLSLLVAIPAGLLIGGLKVLDRILSPYIWAIYTTPRLILMPLVLLYVGINDTARVVIIVLSAAPATLVVVMEGVKTVDTSLLKAARSFGADRARLFAKVVFPSTVPFLATGVRMGISRGLIGLFIGELFTASNGIGYVITLAGKNLNSARTFGMLFIFIMFSVVMVGFSQALERKASRWRAQPLT